MQEGAEFAEETFREFPLAMAREVFEYILAGVMTMRRWLFVFVLFAVMFAIACGLNLIDSFSATVEQIAFFLVPVVFMVASIAGLGLRKQA